MSNQSEVSRFVRNLNKNQKTRDMIREAVIKMRGFPEGDLSGIETIKWDFTPKEVAENSVKLTPDEHERYIGMFRAHHKKQRDIREKAEDTRPNLNKDYERVGKDSSMTHTRYIKSKRGNETSSEDLQGLLSGTGNAEGCAAYPPNSTGENDFTVDSRVGSDLPFDEDVDYKSSQSQKEKHERDTSQRKGEAKHLQMGNRKPRISGDSVVGTDLWGKIVREKYPDLSEDERQFAHLRKPEYVLLKNSGASSGIVRRARIQHELEIRRYAFMEDPRVALEDLLRDVKFRGAGSTRGTRKRVTRIASNRRVKYPVLGGFVASYLVLLYRELKR